VQIFLGNKIIMKYCLLVFLFIFSFALKAQDSNLEIIKSKVFSDEKYKTSLLFAKEDVNGDVFLVRNYYKSVASPKGYYIEHYNKDLELLKREIIEIKSSELRGVYINDSELILLEFKYLQKEKKYAFLTLTSKKDEFNFVEKEIFSIDRERMKRYDYFGIRKEIEFNFLKEYKFGEIVESENNNFIAINLLMKNKDNLDSFQVMVFNNKFEKIYEHTLDKISTENNSESSLFNYQNLKLDDIGNVYLLGKVYISSFKKEKSAGTPNYNYELFKINKQGQKQISFNHKDFFIDKLHLVIKNNNPYCVGLYSIKTHDNIITPNSYSKDGLVRINIDGVSGKILLNSYQQFPENIFDNNLKKRMRGIISDEIKIKTSYVDSDEDIVIFCEEFAINTTNVNTNSISYFYGDIISFKINKEGDLIWANNISKEQSSGNIYKIAYASHTVLNQKNVNNVFLNAYEVEQLESKVSFKYKKNKDNELYLITINENGESNYNHIINKNLKNIKLEVRFGIQLENGTLLFEAKTNDKPLIVKVTI
jgi:hypothetical protein